MPYQLQATLLLLIALCVGATPANAEMYTWTDKDGNLHFTDNPPDHVNAKVLAQPGQCSVETMLEGLTQEQRDQLFMIQRQKQGLQPGTYDLDQDGLDADQKTIVRTLINEGHKCKNGNRQACRCLDRAQEVQTGLRSYTPSGMLHSKSQQSADKSPSR
ncbi:MAG: DUF4124 domain-containing protein [Nitrospiraceae bacterium]|nr:DUF4124 domain-containing protein [Nitrospiraceae bacterium]